MPSSGKWQDNSRKAISLLHSITGTLQQPIDSGDALHIAAVVTGLLDTLDAYRLALAFAAPGRQQAALDVARALIDTGNAPEWLAEDWASPAAEAGPETPTAT